MKAIATALLLVTVSITTAQTMNQRTQAKNVILQLFSATDEKEWDNVERCFAKEVLLDYSSMGNPAETLNPGQITDAWKTILPGFDHTHHQLGNIQEFITENTAHVFAYGTATHYLANEKGNVWTVVGTYDFDVIKEKGTWKISSMKFNFKYQDGNTALAQEAINIVAGKTNTLTVSERNKESVRSFLKALENKNTNKVVQFFAKDGRHINPYHSGLFPEGAKGKEAIRAYWTPVFPRFDSMKFPIEEIYTMEKPNKVFVKFKGRLVLKNNNGHYKNDYYAIFTFNEEGKIVEYVELFNPITAAKKFGLINKIKE